MKESDKLTKRLCKPILLDFHNHDDEGKMTTTMMMMMVVDWIGKWKKLIAIIGLHPTVVTTYQAPEPPERLRENFLFQLPHHILLPENGT